ncbi:hypothetical protein BAX95_05410 [Elizabethkingia meningoseptica]|nr:hypothetical protein BES09_12355 [Elizabethkingia meningoseptica]OHT27344.1 hypothetical protein BFF93_12365 [Elizabethkingia meningoseptica]OPC02987.1 hypothetical protein BAS10_16825 [Elizabethkingia meningoseptica]OPC12888.1 hypothetical protein BAX93_03975 [Elizabethkingia meningoseptica]OPC23320.1 hypothetical protein BAX95_05410 [Elizabethkingia meningoseptica]
MLLTYSLQGLGELKNTPMENLNNLLNRIKEVRKELGYSHEYMAFELEISQAAYTNLERNDSRLTVERLFKIAAILNKSPQYFFGQPQPVEQPKTENHKTDIKLGLLIEAFESMVKTLKTIQGI